MQTEPEIQLPPLAEHDKKTLLLYLALHLDPVPTAESAGLHYVDLLAWCSRPDIAAYVEFHRNLRTKLHRDAALATLDTTMRNTRDETIRCRAAIGILRATDPARLKSRLKTRLSQNSNSPPARTRALAGAAPAHHPAGQNGHIATASPNDPALNESAAQATVNPGLPQQEHNHQPASDAPPNEHHDEHHDEHRDEDHDPDPPDDTPGGPRPEAESTLDQDHPLSPTHAAQPQPTEYDFDEDDEDLDEDPDEDLDDDDLDDDLDDDDDDWDDDDDILSARPGSQNTNPSPDPHSLKPLAAANPDAPEPIPRTIPLPPNSTTRRAA